MVAALLYYYYTTNMGCCRIDHRSPSCCLVVDGFVVDIGYDIHSRQMRNVRALCGHADASACGLKRQEKGLIRCSSRVFTFIRGFRPDYQYICTKEVQSLFYSLFYSSNIPPKISSYPRRSQSCSISSAGPPSWNRTIPTRG